MQPVVVYCHFGNVHVLFSTRNILKSPLTSLQQYRHMVDYFTLPLFLISFPLVFAMENFEKELLKI